MKALVAMAVLGLCGFFNFVPVTFGFAGNESIGIKEHRTFKWRDELISHPAFSYDPEKVGISYPSTYKEDGGAYPVNGKAGWQNYDAYGTTGKKDRSFSNKKITQKSTFISSGHWTYFFVITGNKTRTDNLAYALATIFKFTVDTAQGAERAWFARDTIRAQWAIGSWNGRQTQSADIQIWALDQSRIPRLLFHCVNRGGHLFGLILSPLSEPSSLSPQLNRGPSKQSRENSGPEGSGSHTSPNPPYPIIGFLLGLCIAAIMGWLEKNKKKLNRNDHKDKN